MTLHLSHWNPPLDRKGMEQRWQCWLKAEINAKAQGTGATPRRRGEPTHKLNGTSKCVWGFVCLPEAVGGSSSYKSRRKKKKGKEMKRKTAKMLSFEDFKALSTSSEENYICWCLLFCQSNCLRVSTEHQSFKSSFFLSLQMLLLVLKRLFQYILTSLPPPPPLFSCALPSGCLSRPWAHSSR